MQVILTLLAVILAIFFLGRGFYVRFLAKETSCDGCAMGKTVADIKQEKSSRTVKRIRRRENNAPMSQLIRRKRGLK